MGVHLGLFAVQHLRVVALEYGDALSRAASSLSEAHPRAEPERHTRTPKVVRDDGQLRGHLGGMSAFLRASFHATPYSCDRMGPPRTALNKRPSRGVGCFEVISQDDDQHGRNGYRADRAAGSVLQLPFLVRLAVVRPC